MAQLVVVKVKKCLQGSLNTRDATEEYEYIREIPFGTPHDAEVSTDQVTPTNTIDLQGSHVTHDARNNTESDDIIEYYDSILLRTPNEDEVSTNPAYGVGTDGVAVSTNPACGVGTDGVAVSTNPACGVGTHGVAVSMEDDDYI